MTIKEQVQAVVKELNSWARTNGGRAVMASGPVHVLELLREQPGGVTAAVLFDSEDPRGEMSETGKVDRGFKLILSRGKGFRIESGESLVDGVAGGRPLFDLVEEAREIVRGIEFTAEGGDPEDQVVQYRGTSNFEVQGFVLDAYEVRFGAGAQLPLSGGLQ